MAFSIVFAGFGLLAIASIGFMIWALVLILTTDQAAWDARA